MRFHLHAWCGRLAVAVSLCSILAACNNEGSSANTTAAGSSEVPAPLPPPVPAPAPANQHPSITGAPSSTAFVGQAFDFKPGAVDPENDPMSFVITNKPAWARFDTRTGHLWGTPTAADVGTYEKIQIGVNDGKSSAVLPQFALTVTDQGTRSATVEWDAPTLNTDGTPLVDLQGYKIHIGTESNSYSSTITVNNPGVTRYVIENLVPGTYFISVTAYAASGGESAGSPEIEAEI
jgi:hypothetical protein